MAVSPGLGTYGDGAGVVTPLAHRLAQLGLIAKNGAGSNAIRPGLFYDGVSNIVTGAANMSYNVAAFTAVSSRGPGQGAVLFANDGVVNVATTAAPGTNSRIDVVYAWQREFALDGGSTAPVIGVVQGTPGSSPAVPSLSAFPGAIELARIIVPAGVTATNSGATITQTAPFTTVDGGLLVRRTTAERDAISTPAVGLECFVLANGWIYRYNGTAWQLWEAPLTSFTPTWTNLTVGNGTQSWSFSVAQGRVSVSGQLTFGSTTSISGSFPRFAQPIAGTFPTFEALGTAVYRNSISGSTATGFVQYNPAIGGVSFEAFLVSGSRVNIEPLSATVPFTWGNGFVLGASYSYRAA